MSATDLAIDLAAERRLVATLLADPTEVPAVLGAGSTSSGCRGASQASSLTGPQLGCAARAPQSSCATAASICCGECRGARLRSRRAGRPPASKRASHL